MKKRFAFLLCLLLALLPVSSAFADVIWEPADSFYEMHSEECVYADSWYEAQTEVSIQKDPESSKSVGTVAEGDTVYIDFTWPLESEWGYVETFSDHGSGGWVRLSDLRRLYDGSDFLSEHAEEITGDSDTFPLIKDGAVVLWEFPGSGKVVERIDGQWGDDLSYSGTWTDESGSVWGQVSYYYGLSGWICLSDPSSEDLPVTAPRYAEEEAPAAEEALNPVGLSIPVLVIVLVAAVVIVSAILVFVLTRKKPV